MPESQKARTAEHAVEKIFIERWSPRALAGDPVTEQQVLSLIEAARWAPSSVNEQPWLFVYGISPEERQTFMQIINEFNREWAHAAGAFIALFTRKNFSRNEKENIHAEFDAGAAWMSLALQANALGLHAHAMGGFFPDKAHELLKVPEQTFKAMIIIAVGKKGDPAGLAEKHQKTEFPKGRKTVGEISRRGVYE